MKQAVEIFFAVPPDNEVHAIVLPGEPLPQQIAFAYRLVGSRAVMDTTLGANWKAVVVCTPQFAKANTAKPASTRPRGVQLCFLGE